MLSFMGNMSSQLQPGLQGDLIRGGGAGPAEPSASASASASGSASSSSSTSSAPKAVSSPSAMHVDADDELRLTSRKTLPQEQIQQIDVAALRAAKARSTRDRVIIKPHRKPELVLGRTSSFGKKDMIGASPPSDALGAKPQETFIEAEWLKEDFGTSPPARSPSNPSTDPSLLNLSDSFGQKQSSFLNAKPKTPMPQPSKAMTGVRSRLGPRTPGPNPFAGRKPSPFDDAEGSGELKPGFTSDLKPFSSPLLQTTSPLAPTTSPLLTGRTSSFGRKRTDPQSPLRPLSSPPPSSSSSSSLCARANLLNVDIEWAKESGVSPPTSPQPSDVATSSPGFSGLENSFGKKMSSFGKRPEAAEGLQREPTPPLPHEALAKEGTFLLHGDALADVQELRDMLGEKEAEMTSQGTVCFSSPTLHPATPLGESGTESGKEGSGLSFLSSSLTSPNFGARRSSFGADAVAAEVAAKELQLQQLAQQSQAVQVQQTASVATPSPPTPPPLSPSESFGTRKSSFGGKSCPFKMERHATVPMLSEEACKQAQERDVELVPQHHVDPSENEHASLLEMASHNGSFMLE